MLSVSKQLIAVKAQSVMEGIQFVQELEHHLITLFVKRKAEHVWMESVLAVFAFFTVRGVQNEMHELKWGQEICFHYYLTRNRKGFHIFGSDFNIKDSYKG